MPQPPAIPASNPSTLLGHPIVEGWMLKKKRKKMQGFARRYFYLSQEPPVLSYSFSPNSRIRDSVLIKLASISISRKSRSIHIDSGSSLVMHIKTLTDLDFLRWTSTLQSLVTGGNLKELQTTRRQASKDSSKPLPKSSQFLRSDGGPSVRPVELSNLYHSVARMQAPLSMLEEVQNDLGQLLAPPSDLLSSSQSQVHSRSPSSSSQVLSSQTTAPHIKFHATLPKGKRTILLRHQSQPQTSALPDPQKVYQALNQAVNQLKEEHLNLIDLINTHRTSMVIDQPSKLSPTIPRISPPIHITRNNRSSTSPNSFSSEYMTPTSLTSHNIPPPRRRSSTLTKSNHRIDPELLDKSSPVVVGVGHPSDEEGVESEDDTIFHDAHDLVFVDLDLLNNGQETELEMMGNQDSSSVNDSDSDDGSSSSREFEDDNDDNSISNSNNKNKDLNKSTIDLSSTENSLRMTLDPTSPKNLSNFGSPKIRPNQILKRRSTLPSPVCGDEFSIFSMLKKNVGKDLSQISFPISFNEPLSATQKICEECEYVDELISKAVKSRNNAMERLMYIAGYVVSGFCHTKTRAIRKPFNPMWGETYESIRPDKGMKFLSEKVVHHPPLIAAYAEGENWKLEINSSARQKFWGQSLEIIPEGINRLTIFNGSSPPEVYEWEKPSSFVRNLVSGTKYLEHIGKINIWKQDSEEKATIEFKPGSTFGGEASRNKVEIKVYDQEGRVGIVANGKWDSNLIRSDNNQKIFQAHPLPNRSQEFYGFTKFAIELNEITEDLIQFEDMNPKPTSNASSSSSSNHPCYLLPNTDSRFRPDLRAFENGQVELADSIKLQLEEKQRNRRKLLEIQSPPSSNENLSKIPLWFHLDESGKNWVYKGGYFENRQKDKPEWIDLDLF